MADIVLTDAFISLGGTDVSDHFMSVTLPVEAEGVERTAFGDEWRGRLGGLKDWTCTLSFNQDFASGGIDSVLWPLLGTSVAIVIRPDSAAVGADNPEYSGNGIMTSYPPFGTSVGELVTGDITFEADGELTRAVS